MSTNEGKSSSGHGRRTRAGGGMLGLSALAAAATATAVLLGLRCAALLPAPGAGATAVDRWVELGVVGAGAAAAAWLASSALLALLWVGTALLGRSWHAGEAALRHVAPAAVQRMARAAVGVGVGAGLVLAPAAAHAAPGGEEVPAPPQASVTAPLDLGWQPTSDAGAPDASLPGAGAAESVPASDGIDLAEVERTSSTTASAPAGAARAHLGADESTVVVHRGDTLWEIAASTLDDDASDADVLRAVTRWHEANRDVIGDDPDLILPGQVLRAPA